MKTRLLNLLTWAGALLVALLLVGVSVGGWLTHIAVERNSLPLMRTLMALQVTTESSDPDLGITPLMQASTEGNIEMVRLLLRNGANLHAEDHFGNDPLLYAVRANNVAIARILLEQGCSPTRKNAVGEDAFAVARQNPKTSMLSLLEDYKDN